MPRICHNCFQNVPDGRSSCPFCGYNPAADEGKYRIALKTGTILAGRYYIGRVLGQGGFGITYVALDMQTRSRVAVKEYLPTELVFRSTDTISLELNSSDAGEGFEYGKQKFLEEARTLANFFGNEHIVGIYTYFEENGTAYFAMEYLDGVNLKQYMEQKGRPLEIWEANRILLPVMDALDWVHSKGIVHRDISPDNIIIKKDGAAKLIDFGAARYSTGEKSKSLDVVLKHGFAPVEQYSRRGRQGPFTDVYSMAATYYYAITGRVPPDSIDRMSDDELKKPSAFGIKIRKETEDVLMKALSVQAAGRYQKMSEFYQAMLSSMQDPFAPADEIIDSRKRPTVRPAPIKPTQASAPVKKGGKGGLIAALAAMLVLVAVILYFTTDLLSFPKSSPAVTTPPASQSKQEEPAASSEPSPVTTPVAASVPSPSTAPSATPASEDNDTASIRKDSWINILDSRITGKDPDGSVDAEIRIEYNLAGEGKAQLCLMGYFYDEDMYRELKDSEHIIDPGKGEYTFLAHIPSTEWDLHLSVYMHPYPILGSSWIPYAESKYISLPEEVAPLFDENAEEPWVTIRNLTITAKNSNGTVDADVEVEYSLVGESSGLLQVMCNYEKEDSYRDIKEGESHIIIESGHGTHTFHVRRIPLPAWEAEIVAYIHPNPLPKESWTPIAISSPVSLTASKGEAGSVAVTKANFLEFYDLLQSNYADEKNPKLNTVYPQLNLSYKLKPEFADCVDESQSSVEITVKGAYTFKEITSVDWNKRTFKLSNSASDTRIVGLQQLSLINGNDLFANHISRILLEQAEGVSDIQIPLNRLADGVYIFNSGIKGPVFPMTMDDYTSQGTYIAQLENLEVVSASGRLVLEGYTGKLPESDASATKEPPYEETAADTLEYQVNEDGTAIITRYARSAEVIDIPDKLGGHAVREIGDYAFAYCDSLKQVTIPDTVESIGSQAFYECRNLESISIPQSVSSIDEKAFDWCVNLTATVIKGSHAEQFCIDHDILYQYPDGTSPAAEIMSADFSYNLLDDGTAEITGYTGDIKRLTIPAQIDGHRVSSIGVSAFEQSGIITMTLPEGLTSIGEDAFVNCNSLVSISLPSSLRSIGRGAFNCCTSLLSITIPSGVTVIESFTFYFCTHLTDVVIPDSVTKIDDDAFSISAIKSLVIPASVTEINGEPFDDDVTFTVERGSYAEQYCRNNGLSYEYTG